MKQELEQYVSSAVQKLFAVDLAVSLDRPDPQFGDYATNIALQLAGQLGQKPRVIAESLAAELQAVSGTAIKSVSVAGPGFINVTLRPEAVMAALSRPLVRPLDEQTVVIETNNPNPFKAMHIGHAFNAIMGDTLANILEQGGARTHRVSYHGDVGTHVGKSMWAILRYLGGDSTKLDSIAPAERNAFMSRMYAEGAKAYAASEDVKSEIQPLIEQSFVLDDPLYKTVYETCKAWSFELLAEALNRLGCQPVEKRYLESEADTVGVATVKQHLGTVFNESDGAIIFNGEQYGVFTNVFISSQNRGLYAARDLGLMQLKQADFKPEKSYIVTAEEQKAYFKGVIKAAELVLPELNGVTVNISTGTVKLTTGKMSSRSGEVLDVAWLFEQVEQAIRARGAEPTTETVIGALRYQFLKVRLGSDVVFDIGESVSLQGNTGPYLQYAYARACSILAKAGSPSKQINAIYEADERMLIRKMAEYPEVVGKTTTELLPHHICTYLYELAQTFNRFYEHNRVLDDPRQDIRLQLVRAYTGILSNGLLLLGIPAPQKM